jgi:hypothetical protein
MSCRLHISTSLSIYLQRKHELSQQHLYNLSWKVNHYTSHNYLQRWNVESRLETWHVMGSKEWINSHTGSQCTWRNQNIPRIMKFILFLRLQKQLHPPCTGNNLTAKWLLNGNSLYQVWHASFITFCGPPFQSWEPQEHDISNVSHTFSTTFIAQTLLQGLQH